ncbi:MAG: DsbA family oxidoreductase [Caulobacterales bacterium]
MPALAIDVISDVVCPWCFLGGEYLFGALALVPGIQADIRWRPYQLAPDVPGEGIPMPEYMKSRFGDDATRLLEMQNQLTARGTQIGINFDFPAIKKMPNTLDAHRLILWSAQGGPVRQATVVRALFSAYFEQGLDIGDLDVLTATAEESGLDKNEAAAFLHSGAGVENVLAEIQAAHRLGVEGVPFFLINGKYSVHGAQPAAALASAFRQVMAEG